MRNEYYSLEEARKVAIEFEMLCGKTRRVFSIESEEFEGTREELIDWLKELDEGFTGKCKVKKVGF